MDKIAEVDKILKNFEGREDSYSDSDDRRVKAIQNEIRRLDQEIHSLEMDFLQKAQDMETRRGAPGYVAANRQTGTGGNPYILADIAKSLKFGHAADVSDRIKAVTSASGVAAIQDPSISDDILYALMANNELAMAGAQFVTIENYRQVPKVTTHPAVIWQDGEGTEITVDASLAIGSVKWDLKDLSLRLRVSNQFLMDTSERGRRLVQESMRQAIQDGIGKAVFTGTGANGQPAGIEKFSGLQTVDAQSGEMSDWSQIISAVKKLATANVPLSNISFFGSPEVWRQLASFTATVGDGQPLRLPEALKPIKFMSPTNLVPETYNTNTETAAFLGDFSKIVVGFQGAFEFVLDQTRAHHLETEFLIHMRCDVKATHEDNFCMIQDILIGT